MVTVGYGDLTPQNHYEVIMVMIVQLIGTAVFGYMINVIGILFVYGLGITVD